jgi:glucosamine--fructose-6-phosphate aminotransferase (isomerizing)
LIPYTREVAVLEDERIAVITDHDARILDFDGKEEPLKIIHVDWDIKAAEKGGYEHFMLKEIHEQPEVIRQVLAGRISPPLFLSKTKMREGPGEGDGPIRFESIFSEHVWQEIDRVNIIACGTAYHAGLMGKYMLESLLRLPTDVFYSSEFRYGDPVLSPRSLAIFVSQSGETADSLAALRLCKARRIRTLGIVNVIGSSIARECDRTIFTQAGPEISVASTKAYTAQVLALTLLTLYIAQIQEMPGVRVAECAAALRDLPDQAAAVLELEPEIVKLAEKVKDAPLFFFLGRGADAYVSLEAALKMKEIAYVPTQESPAGEMKHGPLALVEKGVVAVFGATDPTLLDKTVSNMMEVKARGGTIVCMAAQEKRSGPSDPEPIRTNPNQTERSPLATASDHIVRIPDTGFEFLNALLSAIALQLLAYHVARLKGCDIDQPRNLAKSVTVE